MKGWRQRAQDGSSSSSSSSLSLTSSSLTGTITGEERRGKGLLLVVTVRVELLTEEVTEGGEDDATDSDVVDSVEHTAEAGGRGKNAPLGIGRGQDRCGSMTNYSALSWKLASCS